MKRLLSIFLAAFILLSAVPAAFAENSPGKDDITRVGDEKNIQLPKESSYLSEYEYKYVDADKSHSIFVYWSTAGDKRPWYAYQGDKVTVIAREGDYSCVLFFNANGEEKAGWVESRFLVDLVPDAKGFSDYKAWENIKQAKIISDKMYANGEYTAIAVGLKNNGKVCVSVLFGNEEQYKDLAENVSSWSNIDALYSWNDYIFGVHKDGEVSAAKLVISNSGEEKVLQELNSWENIKSLAMDDQQDMFQLENGGHKLFIYGLTNNGKVKSAAECTENTEIHDQYHYLGTSSIVEELGDDTHAGCCPYYNTAASEVSYWTNIEALYVGRHGSVIGVTGDRRLKWAGCIKETLKDDNRHRQEAGYDPKPLPNVEEWKNIAFAANGRNNMGRYIYATDIYGNEMGDEYYVSEADGTSGKCIKKFVDPNTVNIYRLYEDGSLTSSDWPVLSGLKDFYYIKECPIIGLQRDGKLSTISGYLIETDENAAFVDVAYCEFDEVSDIQNIILGITDSGKVVDVQVVEAA